MLLFPFSFFPDTRFCLLGHRLVRDAFAAMRNALARRVTELHARLCECALSEIEDGRTTPVCEEEHAIGRVTEHPEEDSARQRNAYGLDEANAAPGVDRDRQQPQTAHARDDATPAPFDCDWRNQKRRIRVR